MSLQDLANLGQFIEGLVILVGVILLVSQFRGLRREAVHRKWDVVRYFGDVIGEAYTRVHRAMVRCSLENRIKRETLTTMLQEIRCSTAYQHNV